LRRVVRGMASVLPFDHADIVLLLPGLDGLWAVVGADPGDCVLARPSAGDHDAGDGGAGPAVASDAEDEYLRIDSREVGHKITPELPGERDDPHIGPVEQNLRDRRTLLPMG